MYFSLAHLKCAKELVLASRLKHDQLEGFLEGKKEHSKKTKCLSNVQKIKYGLKRHVLLLSFCASPEDQGQGKQRQDGGHIGT